MDDSKTAKKVTLTAKQRLVVAGLQQGRRLTKMFQDGETLFGIEGLGDLNPRTVNSLLQRGVIRETGDAMFGVSQSFELVG
ncbi:hypothetical protein [Fimbriiglobus ruber]|nr:hypothetical protein [Fimbriiglobus ruber]